jgi:hypothetical protein
MIFEWLRHRSFRRHIKTGFAPSIQYLALIGTVGAIVILVVGAVLMFVKRILHGL